METSKYWPTVKIAMPDHYMLIPLVYYCANFAVRNYVKFPEAEKIVYL